MAEYRKKQSKTYVSTGHYPPEATEQLHDKGLSPFVESAYTRYVSLDKDHRGALLDVDHPREEANFDERIGWAKEGATELFTHTPAIAVFATSNKGMGHTFPKLYSMAMGEFGNVVPSSNRSEFSERLARKGADMDAISYNPRTRTNPMTHEKNPIGAGQNFDSYVEPWSDVPKHEVEAATNKLRSQLGYEKKLSPQFAALQKFEKDKDAVYNPSQDPNAMKIPGMD
jgi:hypothetical protein